jgi:hypothetical protein
MKKGVLTRKLRIQNRETPVPINRSHFRVDARVESRIVGESKVNLERFANWLVANGVQGVGTPESKIALYLEASDERGVAAVQGISKGEQLARVPLHLAITDQPSDSEEPADGGERSSCGDENAWSVRLATKLVSMLQQGEECPWKPYLDVLPAHVPTPLVSFEWEDVKSIAYSPGRLAFDKALWLLSTGSSSTKSIDNESFEWAVSVVHSRTFGLPCVTGKGVGIRMLVPLIDMLNHGEDQLAGPPGQAGIVPTDNVRWDVVRRFNNESFMVLSATRDIAQGEELLLSYGERNNDDFFLHYGFIPPRNPHDDVTLFTNLEHATAWLDSQLGDSSGDGVDSYDSMPVPMSESERLKLLSGGQVDARLAELCVLNVQKRAENLANKASTAATVIRDVVGRRAKEILKEMHITTGMRLEEDLQWLALHEKVFMGHREHNFQELFDYYGPKIASSSSTEFVYEDQSGNHVRRPSHPNQPNFLVVCYRVYKAMILWDAVFLWEMNV